MSSTPDDAIMPEHVRNGPDHGVDEQRCADRVEEKVKGPDGHGP